MPQDGYVRAEEVNEFFACVEKILSTELSQEQKREIKQQCSKLLAKRTAVPTKTARRRGHSPKWAIEMVDILNRVQKAPLDTFVIDGVGMVAYMEWWRCLPPERLLDAPMRSDVNSGHQIVHAASCPA